MSAPPGDMAAALHTDHAGRRLVITRADPVVEFHPDLWEQILAGTVIDAGGAPTYDGEHLDIGAPGVGLGRLRYRYERHDRVRNVHILTRVTQEGAA